MSDRQMTKDEIMRHAIALSRCEKQSGQGAPFAAVVVRDGVIVGAGCNHLVRDSDPSVLGELDKRALTADRFCAPEARALLDEWAASLGLTRFRAARLKSGRRPLTK